MRPLKKFLQLTRKTYPSGHETELECHLPKGYKVDSWGNYYIIVGKSRTLFTCHLDTADYIQKTVKHHFEDGCVITDGKTILGADDKAGMTVMLYMIEKQVPGIYYFFLAEEVGCQGSKKLAKWLFKAVNEKKIKKYPFDRVISFDRRGTSSIITHQMYGRCCSEEFANDLSEKLNAVDDTFRYKPDHTGVVTDSAQFMEFIPECTNISVGYYDEHTTQESQDYIHLQALCKASSKIDWESLPTKRDPDIEDEEDENYYDTYLSYGYGGVRKITKQQAYDPAKHSYSEWSERNYTNIVDDSGITKKVFISKTKIAEETDLIERTLKYFQEFESIEWNGTTCWLNLKDGSCELGGSRSDLMDYIPELGEISVDHIRENLDEVRTIVLIKN